MGHTMNTLLPLSCVASTYNLYYKLQNCLLSNVREVSNDGPLMNFTTVQNILFPPRIMNIQSGKPLKAPPTDFQ